MNDNIYKRGRPDVVLEQPNPSPSMGEVYEAYDTLERLNGMENWAFGDKVRRRDAKHAARTVIELAGRERVDQVVEDTQEWLADKEVEMTGLNAASEIESGL